MLDQPLSLEDWPAHLRATYERMVLVSNRDHLSTLNHNDTTTLVVSSDWLLWQSLSHGGWHCVYLEQGYTSPVNAQTLSEDILLRGNDWLYVDGEDATLFDEISLGRGFSTVVARFMAHYIRLSSSLSNLVDKFGIQTLVFFDMVLLDIEITQPWVRRHVAEAVASDRNLKFEDRGDSGQFSPVGMAQAERPNSVWRKLRACLIGTYGLIVGSLSWLLSLVSQSRNRPLIMMAWTFFEPVAFAPHPGTRPIVFATAFPKSLSIVLKLFSHGFLLGWSPRLPVARADRDKLDLVYQKLESHWTENPSDNMTEAVRAHVRHDILKSGQFAEMVADIRVAKTFIKRYRPTRLLVDGVKNRLTHAYVELCEQIGIPVDYIWHAPLAPQNLKFDTFGSDPRTHSRVSRVLSWGQANDTWLRRIGAQISETVLVGNPILGKYEANGGQARAVSALGPNSSALVVQQTSIVTDLEARLSNQYYHFINSVREFDKRNYRKIVFKLHPGIARGVEVFSAIADAFGLRCDIQRYGKFHSYLNQADIVVGPLVSGSALETASQGIKFVPFFLHPTSLDDSYYRGIQHIQTRLEDLVNALDNELYLDNESFISAFGGALTSDERKRAFWNAFAS